MAKRGTKCAKWYRMTRLCIISLALFSDDLYASLQSCTTSALPRTECIREIKFEFADARDWIYLVPFAKWTCVEVPLCWNTFYKVIIGRRRATQVLLLYVKKLLLGDGRYAHSLTNTWFLFTHSSYRPKNTRLLVCIPASKALILRSVELVSSGVHFICESRVVW